ncbi:EamA family transporter RarD [Novosphingobium sp. Gsoil 351]|uniref:EamA family transporter RarD n=1 Tax=Novosphingobium sp. Gsoil 351 TaxID=2675225 RepID=UPI0012B44A85|nr:EamA family transporter RarD [Novosphingobium sp. Gsoil 351]QGN54055.1 EamA family transporter RarD [Novosphingobium sp. Gsoil 351]
MDEAEHGVDRSDRSKLRKGVVFATVAYLIYGIMPFYMKQLQAVAPGQIMAHRVIWSVLLLVIIVSVIRRWKIVRSAASMRMVCVFTITAALIGTNWLVYIWAVLHNFVLETSLGFFITPLMTVLLGVLALKERLSRMQVLAVALAGFGVAALAIGQGGSLWIALALAVTFSTAGLIRKIAPLDPLCALLIETSIMAPLAIVWLGWNAAHGQPVFEASLGQNALLVLTGVVTALPLLLFSSAAKMMPYSLAGQFQYLGPTLQFLQAVLLFHEPFRPLHMFTFGCIWVGLAIFTFDTVRAGLAFGRNSEAYAEGGGMITSAHSNLEGRCRERSTGPWQCISMPWVGKRRGRLGEIFRWQRVFDGIWPSQFFLARQSKVIGTFGIAKAKAICQRVAAVFSLP